MLEDSPSYQQYMESKANIIKLKAYSQEYCSLTIQKLLDEMDSGLEELWLLIVKLAKSVYSSLINVQQCIHKQILDPDLVDNYYKHLRDKMNTAATNNKYLRKTNEILNTSATDFESGRTACDSITEAYEMLRKALDAINTLINDVINKIDQVIQAIVSALQDVAALINCVNDALFDDQTLETMNMIDPKRTSFISKIIKTKQSVSNQADAFNAAADQIDQYTAATSSFQDAINTMTNLDM